MLSATADLADVVLPACTYLEKTDLLSSNNFYLQYMPKIIDPLFESKSDLDAIRMVAEKMGVGKYFDKTPEEYLKQIMHLGQSDADPTVQRPHLGAAHDRGGPPQHRPDALRPVLQQAVPDQERQDRVLRRDARRRTTRSSAITRSPSRPHRRTRCSSKYPLVFLSTHTKFRTHSQYVNLPWLKEVNNGGDGFLEINPKDARRAGSPTATSCGSSTTAAR